MNNNQLQKIEELEIFIFSYLTCNANEFFSTVVLYNNYCKEMNSYPNKQLFITVCNMLNTKYKNIHKVTKGEFCHLCFLTEDSKLNDALKKLNIHYQDYFNKKSSDLTNLETEFRKINNCDVVEYIINNVEISPKLSLTEYFDGTDTVLHILSKNGKINSIRKIFEMYDIDINILNSKGQTIIDVAKDDCEFIRQLAKILLEHKQTEINNQKILYNTETKRYNTNLLETNNNLLKTNDRLNMIIKEQKNNIFKKNIVCIVYTILIFIFFYNMTLH